MQTHEESTYALLVRSEEKSRGVLEILLYAFFILSALVSIYQFVEQPVELSAPGLIGQTHSALVDEA